MRELMQRILEICIEYSHDRIHFYNALIEIFDMLLEYEYMFNFEVN